MGYMSYVIVEIFLNHLEIYVYASQANHIRIACSTTDMLMILLSYLMAPADDWHSLTIIEWTICIANYSSSPTKVDNNSLNCLEATLSKNSDHFTFKMYRKRTDDTIRPITPYNIKWRLNIVLSTGFCHSLIQQNELLKNNIRVPFRIHNKLQATLKQTANKNNNKDCSGKTGV